MEKISVIVPAFNAEKTIKESIQSIQVQTYSNIEIIIVDDGSTDKTAEIVKQLATNDSRIELISINNSGVSIARNIAIENSKGQYIAFLDADDLMEVKMLEKLVGVMSENIDLACCGYTTISEDGKELFQQRLINKIWSEENIYCAIENMQETKTFNVLWNKIFKKDIICKNNIKMNSNISMGEDLLFIIEYIKAMENKIALIDLPLYRYRLSSKGLQATKNGKDSLDRRLQQVKELEKVYIFKEYPKDGLYSEILRCFYTSVSESNDFNFIIKEIYNSNEYKEISKIKFKGDKKNRIFLLLLKSKSAILIKFMVSIFKHIKKIQGKQYSWD